MAKLENEKLGVSFTLPDKPTVRQQLAYYSETGLARGTELFESFWRGALLLIGDWQCEKMPDLNADLDAITDPDASAVIIWAGTQVKLHMDRLDEVPKNS